MANSKLQKDRAKYDALLKGYEYVLPPKSIAKKPAAKRDAAKLLVYDRKNGTVNFDCFRNLGKYLPPRAVLVLNDTKVVPARLNTKLGQEPVELFYVGRDKSVLRCMANRPLERGAILKLGKLVFKILGREERWYRVKPSFPAKDIFQVLERYGKTPLPPYLGDSPLPEKERREKYQTVFAMERGSVAAPTASLHFTEGLLAKLEKQGIEIVRVTLHVNLGTFAPLAPEHLSSGKLHAEEYEVSREAASALNSAKREGRKIVAVGTTAGRTLETIADKRGRVRSGRGVTRIFIREPYRFKAVDALVTNFHVPRSSLLMFVAGLTGREKLLELYGLALEKKFKFLSFGDGMLVL